MKQRKYQNYKIETLIKGRSQNSYQLDEQVGLRGPSRASQAETVVGQHSRPGSGESNDWDSRARGRMNGGDELGKGVGE